MAGSGPRQQRLSDLGVPNLHSSGARKSPYGIPLAGLTARIEDTAEATDSSINIAPIKMPK
jgi:hypothetical protein